MIRDRAGFSCLEFPVGWDTPRFKFGDAVTVDGNNGIVVGACYELVDDCNAEPGNSPLGWWFYVSFRLDYGDCFVDDVIGYHQSVIQPVLAVGSNVIRHQHPGMTPINTLEPLAFGVF